jgi:putative DNA primase/helicase
MMATQFQRAYDEAKPHDGWMQLDLSILRQGVSPPKFPESLLGKLGPLVHDFALSAGSPFDFVAMSLLSMSASVIGAKRRVRPYEESDWAEPATLWVGLVCPPSMGKSPAIRPFSKVLGKLQGEYLTDHETILREWRTESERAKAEHKAWQDKVAEATKSGSESPLLPKSAVEPKEPVARRFSCNDTTPEALARILVGNRQGVAIIADELASFFASFDRYSGDSRGFWLAAWNGDPYTIDRKGSPEPIYLPFLGVSVLGGIQPSKLADALKGPNDGLQARFLWVWPDAPPYVRPIRSPDPSALETVFRALDRLPWGSDDKGDIAPIVLGLDRDASTVFELFDKAVREELADASDTLLMGAVGKMPGIAARLALVCEYLQWAIDGSGHEPTMISGRTMEAVCNFLSFYARPMRNGRMAMSRCPKTSAVPFVSQIGCGSPSARNSTQRTMFSATARRSGSGTRTNWQKVSPH